MAGVDVPTLAAAGAADASRLPARKRAIPKAIRVAVDALTSGNSRTVTDAAEKAGITREYLSRRLSEPHVAEYLRVKAARTVAIASGRASARIGELIDAASEHVSLDASVRTLAIAGISAVQTNVNLNFNSDMPRAGYVLDLREEPRDQPAPRIIDITPAKPTNNNSAQ